MSCKRKVIIKETFSRTKKGFHKALGSLMSLVFAGYQRLPGPCSTHICHGGSKTQTVDGGKWELEAMEPISKEQGEVHFTPSTKEQMKEDRSAGGLQQPEKAVASSYRRTESRYLAAEALARKMKELDMMDVDDMDHVLDIEEALNYYSRLTCPAYQHIIDKFFMDMYLEFNDPEPSKSLSSSMRKVGSGSVHSSRRSSLGPVKL